MPGQIWANSLIPGPKCWKPLENSTNTSTIAKMSLDVSWRNSIPCPTNLDGTVAQFLHFCENIKTFCKIFKVCKLKFKPFKRSLLNYKPPMLVTRLWKSPIGNAKLSVLGWKFKTLAIHENLN